VKCSGLGQCPEGCIDLGKDVRVGSHRNHSAVRRAATAKADQTASLVQNGRTMPKNYARAYPRFWLAYFVASVILTAFSLLSGLSDALVGRGSIQNMLGIAFSVLALMPLYGYVRQRKLGNRWLWWIVLAISALSTGVNTLILLNLLSRIGPALSVLGGLLALAFVLPHLFALYQYVRHSGHIWQSAG
jgi:hypothetical protein